MTENPNEALPGNILVVDDTPANLGLLVGMLKNKGYVVRPAPNGRLALQAAEMQPPDLIMLDINMPEMDGYEVCRRLKQNEKLRNIPVIFISAMTETFDKIKAFGVGGVDYVTKPFQFEEVEARIETHLKLSRYQALIEKWNLQLAGKVREQIYEISRKNEELSQLVERVQRSYGATIQVLTNLVELRNPEMRGHSNNVAAISERVAKEMGLSSTAQIRVAGLLHDIGKIGMEDYIMHRDPEALDTRQFEAYKLHAKRGQAALEAIEDLHDVGVLVRNHHENYDGSGFPDGLRQDHIPIGSRIISIADYFDRAIHNPFLKEDPIYSGFEMVKRQIGIRFDPGLYRLFDVPVREYYASYLPSDSRTIKELSPVELAPGMTLADDIWSGTGILLLNKGSQLSERNIEIIKRVYTNDPPKQGIFVLFQHNTTG